MRAMKMRAMKMKLMTLGMMLAAATGAAQNPPARGGAPAAPPMTLTTNAWADGTDIPAKYTQAGEQVSPELKWTNAPAGTASFVLLMHDPEDRKSVV